MRLPSEILAIDWGSTPAKRQLCRAVLRGRRYALARPEPIVDPSKLELPAGALVGIDCPIGLPASYAKEVGLGSFREALDTFGTGRFEHFYEPATTPAEVSWNRPFYPAKPAGATRDDLRAVLGEAAFELRPCDRATGAGPLFWLVGAKQCGRSSISVWRDVIAPRRDQLALWPFDGPLDTLLASCRPVVAECYPGWLIASVLGEPDVRKRDPASRAAAGARVLAAAEGLDTIAVRDLLLSGFGDSPSGEDAFDATLACLALVKLVVENRLPEPDRDARAVEGWILGL